MSALSAEFEDLLAGRPDDLEGRARDLARTAEAIESAALALQELVAQQHSLSTDAAGTAAGEAASGLQRAHELYAGTSTALVTYAVELGEIQREARSAIEEGDAQLSLVPVREAEIHDLENALTLAIAEGEPTGRIEDDLWEAREALGAAVTAAEEARRALTSARQRMWDAADRAGDQISTAIEEGADSFGDNWNQFWEGVGDVFAVVVDWAEDVLSAIYVELSEAISALVSAAVVAALFLVGALVFGTLFVALGPTGVLLLVALVSASLIQMAISELMAPPVVQRTDRFEISDDLEPRDYRDLFGEIAAQDAAGGADYTEIRVVAVRDAGGEVVGWRVQLPSTQEWSPTNTDGALNDLRTDVMLSMFPELETQYERAAWQAMTDAGVFDSDAPIMFTGWSLGGMMAGEMATDPRVADRVESVVTAGSAIDKHHSDMPDGVRVTQFNNGIDPVHTLEFVGLDVRDYLRFDQDWQTYRPLTWPMHDATMYGDAAEHYLPEPRPGDDIFFAGAGDSGSEEVYVAEFTRGS
ncbi:hypothetical protein ACIGEP_11685 [Microbacterium sp. NPDC077663]|uniref:hypothetical protein n=1 Tax=Microbacterium sp. NPDC077663 TaxID=3364189 RepID=UPI0037C89C23